jgi:DnaJ-class molecular chaperone
MERSSYYQLLEVPRDADEGAIREGYYKRVARFHPDLYVSTLDDDTRQKLISMYSRIVEAYQCLINAPKRERYDAMVGRGKLRYSAEDGRAPPSRVEDQIKNENSQRLFKLGVDQLRAGNAKGALMTLKMALSTEPESRLIHAEIAKAEAALKKG